MRTARALVVATCIFAAPCFAQEEAVGMAAPVAPERPWGPEQATGKPNTLKAGDAPTAWASLLPDAGPEYLCLDYERAVRIAEVRVRETFHPGAVARVAAILNGGEEAVLWKGRDPSVEAPDDLVVKAPEAKDIEAKSVKVYLDTSRVAGWNEIDAVELVGKDGTRQWASCASASSTHAGPVRRAGVMLPPEQALKKACVDGKYDALLRKILVEDDVRSYTEFHDYGRWTGTQWKGHTDLPPGYWVYVYPHWYIWRDRHGAPEPPAVPLPFRAAEPFHELVARPVKVHLENGKTLEGVFVRSAGDFVAIRQPDARKLLFVNKTKILFVEGDEPVPKAKF